MSPGKLLVDRPRGEKTTLSTMIASEIGPDIFLVCISALSSGKGRKLEKEIYLK